MFTENAYWACQEYTARKIEKILVIDFFKE